jgi:hypothetical protein
MRHVARQHIEFVHVEDVAPADASEPFDGARERRLSTDYETGAYTSAIAFTPGWRADLAPTSRPLELFSLRGRMTLVGTRLEPGCYAYVGTGVRDAPLVAEAESLLLVMADAERPPGAEETIVVVASEQMPYEPSAVTGLVIKKLRVDPETGDWTWLAASAPNRVTPRAEIHPTVEEAFLLRGDCLLGGRGEMTPGSYFWRPSMVRHGPLANRNGTLFFFRTKGGGLETTYVDVPGWEDTVREYRSREPYFRGSV